MCAREIRTYRRPATLHSRTRALTIPNGRNGNVQQLFVLPGLRAAAGQLHGDSPAQQTANIRAHVAGMQIIHSPIQWRFREYSQ